MKLGSMRLGTIIIMVVVLIALGVVYYITSRPEPVPRPEPRYYVWDVDMEDLQTMEITLLKEEMSEVWEKHEDRYWYFDEGGPKVDMERWGGGIPLLLSGPGANRLIAKDATDELLEIYGFTDPALRIDLELANGSSLQIEVADNTLTGDGYYTRLAESRNVYTVDYTWYDVISRLVSDPPYPQPEEE